MLKAFDISSATAWVAPNLLKALAILWDTTVRRSSVDQEDLKPYCKPEKGQNSLGDQQSYHLQVLLITERLTGLFFSSILNILPTIWKKELFQTQSEEFNKYVWKFRLTVL